ncbi:hypothetical protein GPA19_20820 [Azoarcus indigens]|uniref:PAS domain-containing protein n=2 Tax=Azoarcus indigens TaxID=29545 RepID=A0A4R6DTC0_9RHOO|nr:hypothetical protein [Azoarcus indigens]TDN47518.1 hypothetical protein C7389_11928 [Azoarcus indigens]
MAASSPPCPLPAASATPERNPFRALALSPMPATPPAPAADSDGSRAHLLAFALPAAEQLHRLADSPDLTVLLADRDGLVLAAIGHLAIAPGSARMEAVAGAPGGGSGLCLAEPIATRTRGLLGLADASARLSHGGIVSLLSLLRTTAELIEHRLTETAPGGCIALHLHSHPELLGTPLEGLMVFDAEGRLLASNRHARRLLALPTEAEGSTCLDCVGQPWPALRARLGRFPAPLLLDGRDGQTLAALVRVIGSVG